MKRYINEYATDVKLHLIAKELPKERYLSAAARIDKAITAYERGFLAKWELMETITEVFREGMNDEV